MSSSALDDRFVLGVQEFNAGNFFEAHELWEVVWGEVVGNEKVFYQGLIQIAAGYTKLGVGQVSGARKLLDRGLQCLRPFGAGAYGVELEPFRSEVALDLDRLRQLPFDAASDLSAARVPMLRLSSAT